MSKNIIYLVVFTLVCGGVFFTFYSGNSKSDFTAAPMNEAEFRPKDSNFEIKKINKANATNLTVTGSEATEHNLEIARCEDVSDEEKAHLQSIERDILAENRDEYLRILKSNIDENSKLAYSLMTQSDNTNDLLKKISELKSDFPDNPIITYDFLSLCTMKGADCNSIEVERSISMHEHNGAISLLSVLYNLRNNNMEKAIDGMINSSNAPVFEEYWEEHLPILENALMLSDDVDILPNQIAATKLMSSIPMPSYSPLVKLCKQSSADSIELQEACLNVGKKLTEAKGTLIGHLIGLALQRSIYEENQNTDEIIELEKRKEKIFDTMMKFDQAMELTLRSSQMTADWLQEIKYSGEGNASIYIVNEALRLSSDPNFNPCEIIW